MTQLITDTPKPHAGPSRFHFARHLVEMFLAMMAGMMVGAPSSSRPPSAQASPRAPHTQLPGSSMAFDMTIPMVAVMLYRGHPGEAQARWRRR